jgi:hypothetical protein
MPGNEQSSDGFGEIRTGVAVNLLPKPISVGAFFGEAELRL